MYRTEFYGLKERLLNKYGRFCGYQIQEIRKPCWGHKRNEYGELDGCIGDKCPKCDGTGIFDIRWIRLEKWEWCGYVFHRPSGDTHLRVERVDIVGRIQHPNYGRASREAVLWLYLLCGEWRLLWQALKGSCSCYRAAWPMLHVQHRCHRRNIVAFMTNHWCGKMYPTWGTGRQVCRKCWNKTSEPADIPF